MPAVIFDLDDTLYPLARFAASGFAAIAGHLERSFGLPRDQVYRDLLQAYGTGERGTEFQFLCARYNVPVTAIPEMVNVYRMHRPQIWPWHDARPTLAELRAAGWRLAVLTNGLPQVQARKIATLRIDSLVDHVIYANEYAPGGKPHRAPFEEALRRLGSAPGSCVMVGNDSQCDIAGANALGINSVLLAREGDVASPAGAHAVVDTLARVPRVASELVASRVAHVA